MKYLQKLALMHFLELLLLNSKKRVLLNLEDL
jgi:hypothetical protein